MYRILCESYEHFKTDFKGRENEARFKVIEPISLITDLTQYNIEKEKETIRYKELSSFLWRLQNQSSKYPEFQAFLWTLESREIFGKNYDVLSEATFDEMVKTVRMFLRLAYWS